jgi:hypothetical protein
LNKKCGEQEERMGSTTTVGTRRQRGMDGRETTKEGGN